jgi:hypothetical protein
MLNEDEVATLESLIRRMSWKQRGGLEAWLNNGHDGHGNWINNGLLWPAVKEAQDCLHWFEGSPGGPSRPLPRLKVVK